MWIIFAIYISFFLVSYILLPIFLPGLHIFQNYFPLFFFFPFFLGRRSFGGRRSRAIQNNGNNSGESGDQLNNTQYDTASWERRNAQMYDEFGIPKKSGFSGFWLYIGMVVVLAVSLALLLYRGLLPL